MKIFISSKVEDFKMDKIEIKGGNRLTGEVKVSGAKTRYYLY